MKETFEDYLQRLKDRRTEDDYKYTDEDFIKYEEYIIDCWLTNLSVYKCLEFMYFAEREIQPEQIWNDQKKEDLKEFIDKHKQECTITKIMQMDAKMAYDSLPKQYTNEELEGFEDFKKLIKPKQETLEEAAIIYAHKTFTWPLNKQGEKQSIPPGQLVPPGYAKHQKIATKHFTNGANWYQEQHNLLPGFIKQFDPKQGEINGEEWTAVHLLKWLDLNKFKIIK